MREQAGETGGPLWTPGDMTFRLEGAGREPDRVIKVRRPFALLGQTDDVDITIGDQAVGARHVYLHLDPRGVYAVDLVTRTGTRLGGFDLPAGWLRPGNWLEVAGRRVELLQARIDGVLQDPPPCDIDMLAGASRTTLVGVSLEPQRADGCPWMLGSALVFLGSSTACGIPLKDRAVARTHCALLRTERAAYIIDLCGHHTWIDDRPVRGASIIHDGQTLTLGSARLVVRVERAAAREPEPAWHHALAPRILDPVVPNGSDLPAWLETIPPESQRAMLAWLMGTVQGSQGEALRQQGEFQLAMTRLLQQVQQDNATLLDAHLARIENVDRELTTLRAELERRGSPTATSTTPAPALPPPPEVSPPVPPLRIARTSLEVTRPQTSTTWLLRRVSQLEREDRSAWRTFLDRFTLLPRRAT